MTAGTTVIAATTKPNKKYRTYLPSALDNLRLALGLTNIENENFIKNDCGTILICSTIDIL
jgi:hypothetical protein